MNMLPKYFTLHGFFEVYIKIEKRKKKKRLGISSFKINREFKTIPCMNWRLVI